MKPLILIADDDPDILKILRVGLHAKGYDTVAAADGREALAALNQTNPDLALLDIEMPHLSGIEVLKHIRQERPGLPVVILTAHATIGRAVEAMKEGATDFIPKPFELEHLLVVLGKALEREGLRREVEALRSQIDSRYDPLVSSTPAMNQIIDTAKKAAQSDATVLLLGESGTGKDLLARSIHAWSPRRDRLFAPVNCVALSEELLESELFGHEKGAFTGAHTQKLGKLEVATGGTVFLDEIGDMKPGLQAKLLRFLQNREFDRVGGTRSIRVDVRIIAATNRDLSQAVKAGAFRADLFYRLNVVSLTLPPLRERKDDIPQIAELFLSKYCREAKKPPMRISEQAMRKLLSHSWPGNVRELQNAIERAVVLKTGECLDPDDFVLQPLDLSPGDTDGADLPFHESIEQHKRRIILRALSKTGGSRIRAAELLGLQPSYLSRLIKQLNVSR
ncbi:MAG: sigma-54 dependent transcriptional regulator [Nitrospirota bacterium]